MDQTYYHPLRRTSFIDSKNYLLLFIVWPFLAFITSLINYNKRDSKIVVYLFLVYFGLSYFIGDTGMDSVGYARGLELHATLPFSDFFKILGGLYSTSSSIDIVEPFISFVVSRITTNYKFLFAAFAALFGYFYLKSVNLLYRRYQEKPGLNSFIFMAFFALILSIYNINGFRMWTAAWIFFYGAYFVVLHHDKKYFLLTLGACLVHWSFFTANFILFIYYFLGNRNLIYFPLVVASFILPNLLSSFFDAVALRAGAAIQGRYMGYSNEEYIESVQEHLQQTSWFVTLSKDLIFYYLVCVILIIFIFYKNQMKEKFEKNLFSFLLLFLSFVNFSKSIASFGNRYQVLFLMFASLYVFLYLLKESGRKIKLLSLLGLFPMALYIAVEFRIGSEVINSWIFSPGFSIPLMVKGIPLSEFLFS